MLRTESTSIQRRMRMKKECKRDAVLRRKLLPAKTAEKRVRQGACGFAEGAYNDVCDRKQNASATLYYDAYTLF